VTGPPEPLSARLGHCFADTSLLTLALTHRSWCAEHVGDESNERLEFLGDSVLGLAVTDHLMTLLPDAPEGHLAKVRAAVVSAPTLAAVAQEIGLGDDLRLGRGELLSGGRAKQSILADALEAVFGAVYLDAGWDVARVLVVRWIRDRIEEAAAGPGGLDFKTRLQELVARRFDGAPVYTLDESGPDHEKRFSAVVIVGGKPLGQGEGSSKKQAEQDAARVAWAALTDAPDAAPGTTEPGRHIGLREEAGHLHA
jgi:ribonuclease III